MFVDSHMLHRFYVIALVYDSNHNNKITTCPKYLYHQHINYIYICYVFIIVMTRNK